MIESGDFEDLFALLTEHEVEYVVVGGYAVAIHARPRFTDDLDLLISRTPENAQRLMAALAAFGYGPPELSAERFEVPNRVVQLGLPPYRVDILTSIKGVTFEEAWAGKVDGQYGDTPAIFIGRAELVRSKQAANRP